MEDILFLLFLNGGRTWINFEMTRGTELLKPPV